MGKTHESIEHLEQAQVAAAQDVKDASGSILKDLKRFQDEKEEDLRRYMVSYDLRFSPSDRPVSNMICTACICEKPDRMGTKEQRGLGGSQNRDSKDRGDLIVMWRVSHDDTNGQVI